MESEYANDEIDWQKIKMFGNKEESIIRCG